MSTDTMDKKRPVDINELDNKQVEYLISQISSDLLVMVDSTIEKANEMLGAYGLQAKMQIAIVKKETTGQ